MREFVTLSIFGLIFMVGLSGCSSYDSRLITKPAPAIFGRDLSEAEKYVFDGKVDQLVRFTDQSKYRCIKLNEKNIRSDRHFNVNSKVRNLSPELLKVIAEEFGC